MSVTGQKDTSAELRIRRRLHRMGYRYRVDYPVLDKPRRRADLAFTKVRVAVFIDGCFWHGCSEHGTWPKANAQFWRDKIETNRRRDLDTNERLELDGWKVIRIWEHEDPDQAANRVAELVESQQDEHDRE